MSDTVNLLKECDAGIKMGIDAIDEVLSHVHDTKFKDVLSGYKTEYNDIQDRIDNLLEDYDTEKSNPNPVAKAMATMKTQFKLTFDDSDSEIAEVITDGCQTGVTSLNRYLNEYESADEKARETARQLIRLMDKQVLDMRQYL